MGLSRMFFVSLSRAHARKNSNIFGFSLTETVVFTFLWKNLVKSFFSPIFAEIKTITCLKLMANTKNYSLRERIIDYYLSKGWYTRKQIEAACNRELEAHGENAITSRQTLINDFLNIERKYNTSIDTKRVGRNTYYRYRSREFSVYKSELSFDDYHRLKGALQVLKSFKGMPQFEWVNDLGIRMNIRLYDHKSRGPIVGFEDSSFNSGIEFFTPIFTAICDKTTLDIDYKSFKRSDSKVFTVSPYYLKEYNNRWFVLGKSPGYDKISIYALDRILSLKNAGVAYEETAIDFDEYFENVIGVTVSDHPVETVEIWISRQQLNYVETKPLHRSQRLIDDDEEGGIFQYDLIPNYELEQAILAFGEHAKVLAPESLKERMKVRIGKNYENYE